MIEKQHHSGAAPNSTPPKRNAAGLPALERRSDTLIIAGNGPSLRGFDFSRFADFDVLGMNAAYRYWHGLGWYPRVYACLDLVLALSHKDEIARLVSHSSRFGIGAFLLRKNLIDELPPAAANHPSVVNLDELLRVDRDFSLLPLTTGSHAALFGAALGYRRLVLLGVDCNYVERVDGSSSAGGIVLEMSETPEDNPNYFFDGYQRRGDRYNLPNPEPDLHLESWVAVSRALQARNIQVWNANPLSKLKIFSFCGFEMIEHLDRQERELAAGCTTPTFDLCGPYLRERGASIDEVSTAFPGETVQSVRTMVDVGAHHGSSLLRFADAGAKVIAFEPDPDNRRILEPAIAGKPNVILDARALGERTEPRMTLYTSAESSGISGLSSFHSTHAPAGTVAMTTLALALGPLGVEQVNFLKIDTEGFDLFVLGDFPGARRSQTSSCASSRTSRRYRSATREPILPSFWWITDTHFTRANGTRSSATASSMTSCD